MQRLTIGGDDEDDDKNDDDAHDDDDELTNMWRIKCGGVMKSYLEL